MAALHSYRSINSPNDLLAKMFQLFVSRPKIECKVFNLFTEPDLCAPRTAGIIGRCNSDAADEAGAGRAECRREHRINRHSNRGKGT